MRGVFTYLLLSYIFVFRYLINFTDISSFKTFEGEIGLKLKIFTNDIVIIQDACDNTIQR